MTRKELQNTLESYRPLAIECLQSDNPNAAILGICGGIALEACYNHHERGQHIWAFFMALKEVDKVETL